MSSTNPFFKLNGQGNKIFTGVTASQTGLVTNGILSFVNIPANKYRAGDLIMIDSMMNKTGSNAGTRQYRLWWVAGNTATLTGAIQLSVRGISPGDYFITPNRRMYIRSANGTSNGTQMLNTSEGYFSDYSPGSVNSTFSNVAIDWTVDGTIFTTITQPIGDVITQHYIKIWEFNHIIGSGRLG
jgi:hypothetical protein